MMAHPALENIIAQIERPSPWALFVFLIGGVEVKKEMDYRGLKWLYTVDEDSEDVGDEWYSVFGYTGKIGSVTLYVEEKDFERAIMKQKVFGRKWDVLLRAVLFKFEPGAADIFDVYQSGRPHEV